MNTCTVLYVMNPKNCLYSYLYCEVQVESAKHNANIHTRSYCDNCSRWNRSDWKSMTWKQGESGWFSTWYNMSWILQWTTLRIALTLYSLTVKWWIQCMSKKNYIYFLIHIGTGKAGNVLLFKNMQKYLGCWAIIAAARISLRNAAWETHLVWDDVEQFSCASAIQTILVWIGNWFETSMHLVSSQAT